MLHRSKRSSRREQGSGEREEEEEEEGEEEEAQAVMLAAYRHIGDPDGVYGCGAGRLAITSARSQHPTHPHFTNTSFFATVNK